MRFLCIIYLNSKIIQWSSKSRPYISFITKTGKYQDAGWRSYRRDSTFIFCTRPKAVFTVCLAVCLLHSLGVQTHCASASSADGIHETSSCRIPVSSRCRRICRAWLAPGNLVRWAWYTYFGNPDFFIYLYLFLENAKNWILPLKLQFNPPELIFFNKIRLNSRVESSFATILI